MSSSYRLELDKWLGTLDVKATSIADVGGSQLSIKGRTKSWDVQEIITYDLANPHVDSPPPDVVLDLNVAEVYPLAAHDLIFCLEVFDYIYDPVHALYILASMLTTKGTLWVTFPTVYPHHQPIEDDALRYQIGGIRKLATRVGLTIEEIIPRRPETDAVEQLWRRERMRAAKHFDHNVTGYIVRLSK